MFHLISLSCFHFTPVHSNAFIPSHSIPFHAVSCHFISCHCQCQFISFHVFFSSYFAHVHFSALHLSFNVISFRVLFILRSVHVTFVPLHAEFISSLSFHSTSIAFQLFMHSTSLQFKLGLTTRSHKRRENSWDSNITTGLLRTWQAECRHSTRKHRSCRARFVRAG